MSERTGIMGKVGGAVDTAAGFMLPLQMHKIKPSDKVQQLS